MAAAEQRNRVFRRFFLGSSVPFFIRGDVDAFASFGGIPRVLLYDNLKAPSSDFIRPAG